jgi:hypothetical protein
MRPDATKADRREGGARSKRHQATEEHDIILEHGKLAFIEKKKELLCAFAALRSPHNNASPHSTNPKWDTSSPRLQPFVLT